MKICKYADEHVVKYVICKMTKEDEIKFQYHLIQCNACRRKVENYRKLRDEFVEIFKKHK